METTLPLHVRSDPALYQHGDAQLWPFMKKFSSGSNGLLMFRDYKEIPGRAEAVIAQDAGHDARDDGSGTRRTP